MGYIYSHAEQDNFPVLVTLQSPVAFLFRGSTNVSHGTVI